VPWMINAAATSSTAAAPNTSARRAQYVCTDSGPTGCSRPAHSADPRQLGTGASWRHAAGGAGRYGGARFCWVQDPQGRSSESGLLPTKIVIVQATKIR
jgi:hypothetical protein